MAERAVGVRAIQHEEDPEHGEHQPVRHDLRCGAHQVGLSPPSPLQQLLLVRDQLLVGVRGHGVVGIDDALLLLHSILDRIHALAQLSLGLLVRCRVQDQGGSEQAGEQLEVERVADG